MNQKNFLHVPHMLSLLQSFVPPLGLLGTLVFGLIMQGELEKHSKEALNWQISLLFYAMVAIFLWVYTFLNFWPLLFLWCLNTISSLFAIHFASKGEFWKYALTIRFVR